ncbi:MAG: hypothetical protein ACRC57_09220, partial [Sarcina sp.]
DNYLLHTLVVNTKVDEHIKKVVFLKKPTKPTEPVEPTKPIAPTEPTKPTIIKPKEENSSFELFLKDKKTKKTLKNVSGFIIDPMTGIKKEFSTNQEGFTNKISFPSGDYTLKLDTNGYKEYEFEINLFPALRTTVFLELEKIADTVKPEEKTTSLTLKLIDYKTNKPISNTPIKIYDYSTNSDELFITDQNGEILDFFATTQDELKQNRFNLNLSIEGYANRNISIPLQKYRKIKETIYFDALKTTPEPTKPSVVKPEQEFAILTLKFVDAKTNKTLANKEIVINNLGTFVTDENGELKDYPIIVGKQVMTFASKGFKDASIDLDTKVGDYVSKTVYLEEASDVTKPITPPIEPTKPVEPTKPTVVKPEKESAILTLKFVDAKTGKLITNTYFHLEGFDSNGKQVASIGRGLNEKGEFFGNNSLNSQLEFSTFPKILKISINGYKNVSLPLDLVANEHIEKIVYLEEVSDVTKPVTPPIEPTKPTKPVEPTKPTVVKPEEESAILTLKFVDAKTNKILTNKEIVINNLGT